MLTMKTGERSAVPGQVGTEDNGVWAEGLCGPEATVWRHDVELSLHVCANPRNLLHWRVNPRASVRLSADNGGWGGGAADGTGGCARWWWRLYAGSLLNCAVHLQLL